LLPKDLSIEYGGTKIASCPGRYLTSLGPWLHQTWKHGYGPGFTRCSICILQYYVVNH